jgi:uncharacterized protein (DUF342 family)
MSNPDAPNSTNEENSEGDIPSCIRFFRRGQNDRQLVASIKPSDRFPVGISIQKIREWTGMQGCDGWFLHEEAISRFSREAANLKEPKEYTLAERKDCAIEIQVSSDKLMAWIRISPAFGGTPPTEMMLREALEGRNVRVGLKEDLIQQILRNGQCERELIAEGVPPTPGEPVRFEQLVHESEHKGVPQERADGSVDYKDLGLFISVTPGTPLLKRIPPTAGSPGTGVDGSPIPAPPAADRAPHASIGTAVSKEDPDVIIATRAGQPYFFENSVRVDPTLEIDSVGPSTGNVVFDGNITVRGPVESGYAIKAGQNLTLLDTVEGANLSAGKNMVLLTGVYGRNKSEISVGGNLEARFLSDCNVHCRGNVDVSDLIAHCNVECEGFIYLGKNGGKGQGFGGRLVAMRGIQAQILGSVSEAATMVELAPPREVLYRLGKVEEQIETAQKTLEIIEKNLHSLKDDPSEEEESRIADFERKAAALRATLDELKPEHSVLQEKADASRKGKIKASEVHHGVTLRIGKTRKTISDIINDLCFQEAVEERPKQ